MTSQLALAWPRAQAGERPSHCPRAPGKGNAEGIRGPWGVSEDLWAQPGEGRAGEGQGRAAGASPQQQAELGGQAGPGVHREKTQDKVRMRSL